MDDDTATGAKELRDGWYAANAAFDGSQTGWRDGVREQFAGGFWTNLGSAVDRVARGMEQLAEDLGAMRKRLADIEATSVIHQPAGDL